MTAIVRNSGLGKMPAGASEVDPNFVLPGPGMDSPARPPTGKGVSPPGFIPGHPPRVVSHNLLWQGQLVTTVICGCENLKGTRHYNMASYCSVCNIEVTDVGEALECGEIQVKKYGQFAMTPSDTMVNSSHDVTV